MGCNYLSIPDIPASVTNVSISNVHIEHTVGPIKHTYYFVVVTSLVLINPCDTLTDTIQDVMTSNNAVLWLESLMDMVQIKRSLMITNS